MPKVRTISFILAGAVLLAMFGCSSDSNNPAPAPTPTPPPPPPAAATVSGTIMGIGPAALDEYVLMSVAPAAGGGASDIVVAADGTYTVELDAGDYILSAGRGGYWPADAAITVAAGEAITQNIALTGKDAAEYAGSEDCAGCHSELYDSFVQSGHPYKLNKVTDSAPPTYPFTSLDGVLERVTDEDGITDNALGTPASWGDVTYVIGGYNWKARFVDADGFIVTGSKVQYNFETDGLVAYHDNEVNKPYNCGNCHTTGWRHYDATLNDARQDGLPGMDGTFAMPGVHCESCHGIATKHAQTMDPRDVVREAQPRSFIELNSPTAGYGAAVSCGDCHTRDGERDYPTFMSAFDTARIAADQPTPDNGGRISAKGGLIKHHEQYDEVLGIDPDDPNLASTRSTAFLNTHGYCGTCHDPHGSAVKDDHPDFTGIVSVDKSNEKCTSCHPRYETQARAGGMTDLMCKSCHMPALSKSALAHAAVGEGPVTGDINSHLFRITLDPEAQQFTESGSFSYPQITTDWSCRTCHNAVDLFGLTDVLVQDYVYHNNVGINP